MSRLPPPMYHLPQLYADIHHSVTEDLRFYRELADTCCRRGGVTRNAPVPTCYADAGAGVQRTRVLELGCGTGRIAGALAAAGHEVAGIDSSEEMLSYAARKAPDCRFLRADMRDFDLAERFGLVILGLNGVGHLHTDSDLAAMFGCVGRHLAPGGCFALHLFTGGSGVAPDGGGLVQRGVVFSQGRELSWYEMRTISATGAGDRSPRYEHLSWYFFGDQPDAEPMVVTLELRIHHPDQLRAGTAGAGLTPVAEFTDFGCEATVAGESSAGTVPTTRRQTARTEHEEPPAAGTAPPGSPSRAASDPTDWIGVWERPAE